MQTKSLFSVIMCCKHTILGRRWWVKSLRYDSEARACPILARRLPIDCIFFEMNVSWLVKNIKLNWFPVVFKQWIKVSPWKFLIWVHYLYLKIKIKISWGMHLNEHNQSSSVTKVFQVSWFWRWQRRPRCFYRYRRHRQGVIDNLAHIWGLQPINRGAIVPFVFGWNGNRLSDSKVRSEGPPFGEGDVSISGHLICMMFWARPELFMSVCLRLSESPVHARALQKPFFFSSFFFPFAEPVNVSDPNTSLILCDTVHYPTMFLLIKYRGFDRRTPNHQNC